MPRYLVEGRVIPERVDFNVPPISFEVATADGKTLSCKLNVIKSIIFVHVDAPHDIDYATIRNMLFNVVGNIVNYGGFYLVTGMSYDLDSITNVDDRSTVVFGVEGHVFQDRSEFGDKLTFAPTEFGKGVKLSIGSLQDAAVSRATFELRNSIRHPDFTALHCRLAIEAVRNAFNADDEKDGWEKLRETLRIRRETIESFKGIATTQRHGKNEYQTWEQRRRCMQIAWEITYRYIRHLENDAALKNSPLL